MEGQHGFARNLPWTLCECNKEKNMCTFSLSDSEITKSKWKNSFLLKYAIQLLDNNLITSLTVTNTNICKDDSFDFTCLLHTYFNTSNVTEKVVVSSFESARKPDGCIVSAADSEIKRIQAEIDENFYGVKFPLFVRLENDTVVQIKTEKLSDVGIYLQLRLVLA